jgi:hypothetical protein
MIKPLMAINPVKKYSHLLFQDRAPFDLLQKVTIAISTRSESDSL